MHTNPNFENKGDFPLKKSRGSGEIKKVQNALRTSSEQKARKSTVLMSKGGEGNGTPLQYSYLENPMDGGAW